MENGCLVAGKARAGWHLSMTSFWPEAHAEQNHRVKAGARFAVLRPLTKSQRIRERSNWVQSLELDARQGATFRARIWVGIFVF